MKLINRMRTNTSKKHTIILVCKRAYSPEKECEAHREPKEAASKMVLKVKRDDEYKVYKLNSMI